MLTKKSLLPALIVPSVCHACAAQARDGRRVSLLVSYVGGDGGDVQHVERFDFVDDEVVSRKRVVTLNHDADGYVTASICAKHYLMTANPAKVFDLQTGRFIKTRTMPAVSKKEELPGLVSPDGTRSVNAVLTSDGSTDGLEFHSEGGALVVVQDSFSVTVNHKSSYMARLPLLWVDDERVLTQRSNGDLVSEAKRAWTTLTVGGWGAEILGWVEE